MTVPLTGSQGLFTRLGHILGRLNNLNVYLGTTFPPQLGTIDADYATTDQNLVGSLYSQGSSFQALAGGSWPTYLSSLAQNTIIQMAADDGLQPNSTLSQALQYIINQMKGVATVQRATVGSSVVAGVANVGNPVWVISVKRPDGLFQENLFAEAALAATVADGQVGGGATTNREQITLTGLQAAPSPLNFSWPGGSGAVVSAICVDAGTAGAGGNQNFLVNSNFESFNTNPNVPDQWVVDTGTPGTQIKKGTIAYDGTASLQFAGDNTTLTAVHQEFNNSNLGTVQRLLPLTQYCVNLWVKFDVAPASGTLRLALTDGSNSVINDAQGLANAVTQSISSMSTAYTPLNATFRTPASLPPILRLQLSLTAGLSTGSNLYMDRLAFAQPYLFYPGGPYLSVFSGSIPTVKGLDTWVVTFTNNRTSTSNGGFQFGSQRLLNMNTLGFVWPSALSPTISDALIV
jgi:hypothetical protein